jgi:hypothetical protein
MVRVDSIIEGQLDKENDGEGIAEEEMMGRR